MRTDSKCGKEHLGRCTGERPVFTREQAVARLREMGYEFNYERADWQLEGAHPDDDHARGRLAWTPDYCRPDEPDRGTEFFLRKPWGLGVVRILGGGLS